ncbi:hypothetical protein HYU50_03845 [Candidatus Woesearchaeota archaeon]|nr:hypothetical protein [Candidatus Woesearchaeota archaeon]
MKLSGRKTIFILLAALGMIVSLYFLIMKEWFLLGIGLVFSFVAAYNITCGDK